MEQILTKTGGKVDAVAASADGIAGGAAAALAARGLRGIPLSGQDGEQAALNRVALGQQTVSVWKDSRALGQKAAEVASALAAGKAVAGAQKWDGGARKIFMDAVLLQPVPITRANLDLVVKAGWIRKEDLCRNVPAATGPAACK